MATTYDDERDRVSRQARAAWQRLKKEKSWGDWLICGEGLVTWRNEAMKQAGTNEPQGKAYNMAFSILLNENKLDDMDKGDRARLFQCMDNIALIEEWRRILPQTQRLRLNHPSTVFRNWKRAIDTEAAKPKAPKPTIRDAVAGLSEENERLKARIAEQNEELAAAREVGKDQPESAEQMHARYREFLLTLPIDKQVEAVRHLVYKELPWKTKQFTDLNHFVSFDLGQRSRSKRR